MVDVLGANGSGRTKQLLWAQFTGVTVSEAGLYLREAERNDTYSFLQSQTREPVLIIAMPRRRSSPIKAERRPIYQAARPTSGDDLSIPINLWWVMCSEGPVETEGVRSWGLGGC
jgi:hypothetical protein